MQGFLLAVCRIALGAAFLIFGGSKLFLADAFDGKSFFDAFPLIVKQYLEGQPYPFWRPFLEHVVTPNAAIFAWGVAVGETLLGLSLLLGFWTRLGSILGIFLIASIHFCKSPFAAPGPFWMHVSGMLEHLSIVLLLLAFAATGAGGTLGVDGRRKKSKAKAEPKEKVAA